jgi:SAM-dependent methyltransferase
MILNKKIINLSSMENSKKLVRICPICNQSNGTILHTQHFSLPEKSLLPSVYDVVSCNNCGFCFADTSAKQEDYDKYYNEMSKYEDKETASGGGLDSIDKARLNTAAEKIAENYSDKNASILDIGCANGGLLQCLNEKGYTNLTGIDITQICVENVKKLGYNAYFGGIFNLEELGNKKYDIVILSHVLEHVYDLQTTAENLKKLLNPNGIIYIEVPDASRYPNYYVVPYYYFDCEHINHFDINSLKNLFEDSDFKCSSFDEREIKVSATTPYPAVSVIFKKNGEQTTAPQKKYSNAVINSIKKYIEISKEKTDFSEIEKLITSQFPVLIWGAGMYTLRLLENSPIKKCNILYFMDKDFKKQGNTINNIEIKNPNEILKLDKSSAIIVSSAIYGNEIEKEIRLIDGNDLRNVILL